MAKSINSGRLSSNSKGILSPFRALVSAMSLSSLAEPHQAPSFTLRVAGLEDVPRIRQCNLDNLPENYPDSFFAKHIYSWPEISLVAEDVENNYLVGYALGRVEMVPINRGEWYPGEKNKYMGHVTSIAVDRDYRGYGLASSLMEQLHKQMLHHYEVERISLHCRITNQAAISLYKKLNYNEDQTLLDYYADNEDALIMSCSKSEIEAGLVGLQYNNNNRNQNPSEIRNEILD